MTQDYENSLIKPNSYYSYVDVLDRPKILEVVAGYGRNSVVNLLAFRPLNTSSVAYHLLYGFHRAICILILESPKTYSEYPG
jgi:hypothetical protein